MITLLRIFGIICAFVGILHIALGLNADALLGASLNNEVISNSSLDSQNRFYGAAFTLFGVVSWICASEPARNVRLFQAMMIVFLIGGLARLISAAVFGLPAPAIQFLAFTELVIPPIFLWWHRRFLHPVAGKNSEVQGRDMT